MAKEKYKKGNSEKVRDRYLSIREGSLAEWKRILTGNPQITLVSVKTQYVISKITSHGARLDVLAEDTEKTLYHLEIEGADVADSFDDSEGELSKRVRFLKTGEGGIEIMCEIMERIREEGIREGKQFGLREGRKSGRLESSRKTALNLDRMGMPPETIACAVEEDVTVVKQWLKAAKK